MVTPLEKPILAPDVISWNSNLLNPTEATVKKFEPLGVNEVVTFASKPGVSKFAKKFVTAKLSCFNVNVPVVLL